MIPRFPIRAAVAVQTVKMNIVHKHGMKYLRIKVHRSDGQCADRFPMVRFRKAHEPRPFRMAGLVMVLESHLERCLYAGRTVVMKSKAGQSLR